MNYKPVKIKLGLVALLCLIIGAEAWAQPIFNRGQQRVYQRNNTHYQRNNTQYQQRQQPYYQNQNDYRYRQQYERYERQPQYQYDPRNEYYNQKNNPANQGFLTPDYEAQAERIKRANYGDVHRVPYTPYQRPYYRGY